MCINQVQDQVRDCSTRKRWEMHTLRRGHTDSGQTTNRWSCHYAGVYIIAIATDTDIPVIDNAVWKSRSYFIICKMTVQTVSPAGLNQQACRMNKATETTILTALSIRFNPDQSFTSYTYFILENVLCLTIWRSSIRELTPAAISFLSCGVSGQGYRDARKLK